MLPVINKKWQHCLYVAYFSMRNPKVANMDSDLHSADIYHERVITLANVRTGCFAELVYKINLALYCGHYMFETL